ncbi:MAG: HD domain-containing protein [Chitinivibrionales bacterium]|nr:HD domain-containing protein [Chitinivibrionales bacterium]MBD3357217.1 HD domain-containing protein [Chitinivibrionales bacterium]
MSDEEKSLILIAEGNKGLRIALTSYLERSGHRIVSAYGGQQVVRALTECRPDLAVIDLRPPVMDGIELLKAMQRKSPLMPIIVTTDHADDISAVEILHNGAFDYIAKPYKIEFIGQKVERALNASKLAEENTALSDLAALHEIANRLTNTQDLDELLDIAFESCVRVLQAESGSLKLLDKERKKTVTVREKELDSPPSKSSCWAHHEEQVATWVAANGRSLLLAGGKVHPDVDFLRGCADTGSSICVPLKVGCDTIGVVFLSRPTGQKPFTLLDLNTIDVLASQVGVAVNNAKLYASLNRKIAELSLISTYSERLMGLVDRDAIVLALFRALREHFGIEVTAFLVIRKRSLEFNYSTTFPVSEQLMRRVCNETIDVLAKAIGTKAARRRVSMRRVGEPPDDGAPIEEPFAFRHVMPLMWEDFSFGVLYFAARREPERYDETMGLLLGLINQTRIALTNAKLYTDMRENYIRTIKALAIAVDAKDTYTHGHSENVMNIAGAIAAELKLDDKWMGIIRDAGLLHDIGKIGIPGYILNKPGPLTYEEFNGIMKTHSNLGANIVKDVPFLEELYTLILYHHEHFDGTGYPEGLTGEDIPLGARILHVADAFEAMTSNRPYRNSLGETEALKRLLEQRGKQFDPVVVDAFVRMARKKGWLGENRT